MSRVEPERKGATENHAAQLGGDVCTQYKISCADDEERLREMTVEVAGLSELFKALADPTRTKILYLLSERELCVCDLAYLLDSTLPAVSHHLRLLKLMRLVSFRKEGKMAFYRLADDHVLALIRQALDHFHEETQP